jgi:hypothetical protein
MALDNIINEPRREIIEQALGTDRGTDDAASDQSAG